MRRAKERYEKVGNRKQTREQHMFPEDVLTNSLNPERPRTFHPTLTRRQLYWVRRSWHDETKINLAEENA